jgi:hypothetical protein
MSSIAQNLSTFWAFAAHRQLPAARRSQSLVLWMNSGRGPAQQSGLRDRRPGASVPSVRKPLSPHHQPLSCMPPPGDGYCGDGGRYGTFCHLSYVWDISREQRFFIAQRLGMPPEVLATAYRRRSASAGGRRRALQAELREFERSPRGERDCRSCRSGAWSYEQSDGSRCS